MALFGSTAAMKLVLTAPGVLTLNSSGTGAGAILNQGVRLRSIIIPVLFVPTMMAPVVVAILWKIMLAGSWGLLSYNVIERFGILRRRDADGWRLDGVGAAFLEHLDEFRRLFARPRDDDATSKERPFVVPAQMIA